MVREEGVLAGNSNLFAELLVFQRIEPCGRLIGLRDSLSRQRLVG